MKFFSQIRSPRAFWLTPLVFLALSFSAHLESRSVLIPPESALPTNTESTSNRDVDGAIIRFENLTKVPGTDRSFPEEDFLTFHRTDRLRNSRSRVMGNHDSNNLRIHNEGSAPLVITQLTTTNLDHFEVVGVSIPSAGLSIAAGSYLDVTIKFVKTGGTGPAVIRESLIVMSNADNAGQTEVTLSGAYMLSPEGHFEVDAQQIFDAYGFQTSMGRFASGNLLVRPGSYYPSDLRINSKVEGDMIITKSFVAADPDAPVRLFQLGAFHSPGSIGSSIKYYKAGGNTRIRFFHDAMDHQTLFPKLKNNRGTIANGSNILHKPFYVSIGNYYSSGGTSGGKKEDELLGVRVYRAINRDGEVIPNEYIIHQDYIGSGCATGSSNCDWNDNTLYLINARPVDVPTAVSINDTTVNALEVTTYNITPAFHNGYPGNILSYTATLANGDALPAWVTLDEITGDFNITAPSEAVGTTLDLRVTATDGNMLSAESSFSLAITVGHTSQDLPNEFWLEAECATVGSNFVTEQHSFASEGRLVYLPEGGSSNSPPEDVPANRVRFTVNGAEPGNYHLFARVRGDDTSFDSFWVRVNGGEWIRWFWRHSSQSGLVWAQVPQGPFGITSGINVVDFAYRESRVYLDKIHLNKTGNMPGNLGLTASNCSDISGPTTTGPVADAESFWLEAECALVGSSFVTEEKAGASGGEVVYLPSGGSSRWVPEDVPANRVRFIIDNAVPGNYHIFAHVRGDHPRHDSYWVRVNGGEWIKWYWRNRDPSGLVWSEVFEGPFALTDGVNEIDFAFRERKVYLDKIHLNRTGIIPVTIGETASNCGLAPTGPPVPPSPPTPTGPVTRNAYWLEAECGEVGSRFAFDTPSGASASEVISVKSGPSNGHSIQETPDNRVRFTIDDAEPGDFTLFARVRGDGHSANSYWVRVNEGPWTMWAWRDTDRSGLVWSEFSGGPLTLTSGVNHIDFAFREKKAYLDKVHLNKTGIKPTGYGILADNCPGVIFDDENTLDDPIQQLIFTENELPEATTESENATPAAAPNEAPLGMPGDRIREGYSERTDRSLFTYPNPTSTDINFQLSNDYRGKLEVIILSVNGNVVRRLTLPKTEDLMQGKVVLGDLAPGTYILRLVGKKAYEQSLFVKLR